MREAVQKPADKNYYTDDDRDDSDEEVSDSEEGPTKKHKKIVLNEK